MREVTISREPHRLSGPLSSKIAAIRTRFGNARSSGMSIDHDEMEAIFENLREMAREARKLEEARVDPISVAAVSYHLVAQVGDELLVLRALLSERVHSAPRHDSEEQIVCAFARARALLAEGEAAFVGKVKP